MRPIFEEVVEEAKLAVYETGTLHTAFGRAVYYDFDAPLRRHVHSALHVLIHLGGAPATYTFADGLQRTADGDAMVLIDPWVAHADQREGTKRTQLLALYVEPTMVRTVKGKLGQVGWSCGVGEVDDELSATITSLVERVLGDRSDATGLQFSRVIEQLLERFGDFERAGSFPGAGGMDRHVAKALAFLNDRKGRAFDGAAVVAESGLARSRLFERFTEVVGMPPKAYSDALRAEAAIGMLAADEQRISEIAAALEFRDPAHFSRFMRDYTGLSPSEHRRMSNGSDDASVFINEFD